MIRFSLAHNEARNLSNSRLSKLSDAVGLTSPTSKSTSRIMALGKPRLTISSRRMGKISSERSAERRRSAADCFDNPPGTSTSGLASNRGLAILPTPLVTPFLDTTASATGGYAGHTSRGFNGDLRFFDDRAQLGTRNQAHHADSVGVLQISINRGDDDAGLDSDQIN